MIIGGLRARFIKQALHDRVYNNLELLGWLDSETSRADVTVIDEALDHDEEAVPNIVAVSMSDVNDKEWEMGSLLSQHSTAAYVDVYAESEALGIHLAGDIKDILQGRFTSLGQSGQPRLSVLQYNIATPTHLFYVDLTDIRVDKSPKYAKPFLKHWFQISLSIEDFYDLDS